MLDTSDLMRFGARALVVDLCKKLEEVVKAFPEIKRFAYSLARESVGMKPAGRQTGAPPNGATRARLAADLLAARQARKTPVRKPMTDKQKRLMSRIAKARWEQKRRLGLSGGKLPRTAELKKAEAKEAKKNGGQPASE